MPGEHAVCVSKSQGGEKKGHVSDGMQGKCVVQCSVCVFFFCMFIHIGSACTLHVHTLTLAWHCSEGFAVVFSPDPKAGRAA